MITENVGQVEMIALNLKKKKNYNFAFYHFLFNYKVIAVLVEYSWVTLKLAVLVDGTPAILNGTVVIWEEINTLLLNY